MIDQASRPQPPPTTVDSAPAAPAAPTRSEAAEAELAALEAMCAPDAAEETTPSATADEQSDATPLVPGHGE